MTVDALSNCPRPLRRPRIAIVDTGVSASALQGKATLSPIQFDVRSIGGGTAPADETGHGTVVARIIEHLTPDVDLQSIRVAPRGSIAAVIMGIQLAMSTFQPDVVNLSLSVDLPQERCVHCGEPVSQLWPELMIENFFKHLDYHPYIEPPTYVAAAGNFSPSLRFPARCANVLAAGAY
ncbi:MAG TPA: S8 family serine peptidase, partial [Thermoanaerobaculia bacterium]